MGRLHRAFLIAKVVPHGGTQAKYRCVAAMHHHWCYGILPLRAVRRFITLLKKPLHQKIIHEELRLLDGQYGRQREEPKFPSNPCPFSSFLLITSFNVDCSENLEDAYVSGLGLRPSILSANSGIFDGGDDTDITVIDITNPEDPAYCFVPRIQGGYGPVSSAKYLGFEVEPPEILFSKSTPHLREVEGNGGIETGGHDNSELAAVISLQGERLITLEMLAEAWKDEYLVLFLTQEGDTAERSESVEFPIIPPLSDLALRPAVDYALKCGDTGELEKLLWLPGKADAIFEILKKYQPFPDNAISLLSQGLNQVNNGHVDLSGFYVSEEQIISLLASIRNVEVLDLSHNTLITIHTVRVVLVSLPMLKHLVLLNTSITNEDLSSLFYDHPKLFYNLYSLTHPLLLTSNSHFPNVFAIIVLNPSMRQLNVASLPFITPTVVVQALTDYLRTCLNFSPPLFATHFASSILPCAVLSSAPRTETETWSTRLVPMIASRYGKSAIDREGWIFGVNSESEYGFFQVQAPESSTTGTDVPSSRTSSTSSEGNTRNEQQQYDWEQHLPPRRAVARAPGAINKLVEEHQKLGRIHKVLDLKEFLARLISEGRTPAPEPAVVNLFAVLHKLQSREIYNFPVMDLKKANRFLDLYHVTGMYATYAYHYND